MNISNKGIDKIEAREGVRSQMYRDSAGLPTIGVGHLLTKDELKSGKIRIYGEAINWHIGLSMPEIHRLLDRDLDEAEIAVTTGVAVPLTQTQFDTLVSFVFNIGVTAFRNSTLRRSLNEGKYDAVPGQLRRWIHSAGQIDPILVKRREDEVKQWETA